MVRPIDMYLSSRLQFAHKIVSSGISAQPPPTLGVSICFLNTYVYLEVPLGIYCNTSASQTVFLQVNSGQDEGFRFRAKEQKLPRAAHSEGLDLQSIVLEICLCRLKANTASLQDSLSIVSPKKIFASIHSSYGSLCRHSPNGSVICAIVAHTGIILSASTASSKTGDYEPSKTQSSSLKTASRKMPIRIV